MSKEFDVYNKNSWIYADNSVMKYQGIKLFNYTTKKPVTQKKVVSILENSLTKEKRDLTEINVFREVITKSMNCLYENSRTYYNLKKYKRPYNIKDFSTWKKCKNLDEVLKVENKPVYKPITYEYMKVGEFMGFCTNIFSIFNEDLITLAERNFIIDRWLQKFYIYQTDIETMKKNNEEADKREALEREKEAELQRLEDEKNGVVPPEMSGVIYAGHELTLAQYTYFCGLCKFNKEQIEKIITVYHDGRKEGKRGYMIRQDLFAAIPNSDQDFIFALMKANFLYQEVSTFVDFLFDHVSECETVEDVEKIFNFPYFEKHPEIKNSILEDNLFFGIENNKIFRKNS